MQRKVRVFIYRPDLAGSKNIIPDLCFTPDGQNYREWQRDQEELYQYKLEQAKREIENKKRKHKHFIEVGW